MSNKKAKAMNIQQQIEHNRKLLRQLPEYCNFAKVWEPSIQDYTIQVVWQSYNTGMEVQEVNK